MAAVILKGLDIGASIAADLTKKAAAYNGEHGTPAGLAILKVGDHPATRAFLPSLTRACDKIGLAAQVFAFSRERTAAHLREPIVHLNVATHIQGVLLLLPLPDHIQQRLVTEVLDPRKDVDGLGPRNAGNFVLGFPSFLPCAAEAMLTLLREAALPIAGKNAVVVGRSNVGGKPMAYGLLAHRATVTICHTYTPDLAAFTRRADILVVTTGRPGLITAEMVKPGAVVLDAGLNYVGNKIVGDVDFDQVREVAGYLTPVPGGMGPLITLMILKHTLEGPSVP